MNHYIAEGQFIPRTVLVITAQSLEAARRLLSLHLDAEFWRQGWRARRRRHFSFEPESYIITELPQREGVEVLPLWGI